MEKNSHSTVTCQDLFPSVGITSANRLYVIGNGFDIHHKIKSRYIDFKSWLQENKNDRLIGMMDMFFSNEHKFWSDIEKALGEYDEKLITDFCEPICSSDFKYDHPTQWQAGLEDSISFVFGDIMDEFRHVFEEWVKNIDIDNVDIDLQMPQDSKYLSFNYTETLEKSYGIPAQNILHIHGSRLQTDDSFIIGHNIHRDVDEPFEDDGQLLPYQNAYSSVIDVMNEWNKGIDGNIETNKTFFQSLSNCKGISVIGVSYNDIDMPYLKAVVNSVAPDTKWILYYYSIDDMRNAIRAASILDLTGYKLKEFD